MKLAVEFDGVGSHINVMHWKLESRPFLKSDDPDTVFRRPIRDGMLTRDRKRKGGLESQRAGGLQPAGVRRPRPGRHLTIKKEMTRRPFMEPLRQRSLK